VTIWQRKASYPASKCANNQCRGGVGKEPAKNYQGPA